MIDKAYAITFDPVYGPGGYNVWSTPDVMLEKFFTNLLGFLTIIGGIAFLIYFVLGAMTFLTAGGSPENIAKAQRYISNALIGIILVVAAWAIVGIFGLVLGFDLLNLVGSLPGIRP